MTRFCLFDDADPTIRLLAVETSRLVAAPDVVPVWFLRASKHPRSRRRRGWIEQLVNNDDAPGLAHIRHDATREVLGRAPGDPNTVPPEVTALAGYILCRAAVGHAGKLNGVPNDRPEWRCKQIVAPLIHIPRELFFLYGNGNPTKRSNVFTAWLPHEKAVGDPPRRELAGYLIEQLKEPAKWCEAARDRGLPSEIEPGAFAGGKPPLLGTYLDYHKVGGFAEVEKAVRAAMK